MANSKIKLFVATKAFIEYQGKILIIKESATYQDGTNQNKYDVPGGRVKPGQNFTESLLREVKKETGLKIKIIKPFWVDEWRPQVKNELWQIVGIYFKCQTDSVKVTLSSDHNDFKWINPQTYKNYDLINNLKSAFIAYLN